MYSISLTISYYTYVLLFVSLWKFTIKYYIQYFSDYLLLHLCSIIGISLRIENEIEDVQSLSPAIHLYIGLIAKYDGLFCYEKDISRRGCFVLFYYMQLRHVRKVMHTEIPFLPSYKLIFFFPFHQFSIL